MNKSEWLSDAQKGILELLADNRNSFCITGTPDDPGVVYILKADTKSRFNHKPATFRSLWNKGYLREKTGYPGCYQISARGRDVLSSKSDEFGYVLSRPEGTLSLPEAREWLSQHRGIAPNTSTLRKAIYEGRLDAVRVKEARMMTWYTTPRALQKYEFNAPTKAPDDDRALVMA